MNYWKDQFEKVTNYWYDKETPNMHKFDFIGTVERRINNTDIYDKRKEVAKMLVNKVNELFHLQETQDWEEKAINEILKYI